MSIYSQLLPYGVAIGSTAIALLVSLWLESLLSQQIFALFYIVIIVSTWYGGFRPGMVTVVLSTLAIDYFLIPPQSELWMNQPEDLLQLGLFLMVALTINLLTSNFIKSTQKIQKLSQQLAQNNTEQLRMALSAAQMGIWDWNIVTGQIIWSPEHEQLFGLAAGTFDGKYETFDAWLHPEDRPGLNQAIQQALQTHTIYQHEFRIIWADSSIHWVEGRGQGFYDPAGQPVRMTGTIMAIDERKQAQEALRQSEERYRNLFESIDEGFCVIEMLFDENDRPFDYRFLEINPQFENQTGLKQAVGKTARGLVPNLEEHWFEIYGKVALTGESIRFEHSSEAINRWFDVYALRVGQPSNRKIAIVFKDITQGKQAQISLQQLNIELEQRVAERTAQLAQTNHRLIETVIYQQQTQLRLLEQAQLLDLAHDTIMTRDLKGAIAFWNQGAEYMYGWTKAEALGQISHTLLKTQFPQPIAEIEAELLEKGYWEGELIHFHRDARPVNVASRWVLQKDNAGKPIKILEINNDITERKQAEAAQQAALRDRKQAEKALRQYERIVSSTKDGIALVNSNHIYQIVNQAYLDWCNKPDSEVLGNSKRNVLGEKLFDSLIQSRLNRCLAGETIQNEQWFDYPNLVPQFMSVTYTPYREPDGRISGVIVSLRDLTQLKQAEQMLELQAVITRNMAEGICLVRADNGVIVYANPKFEQMFGYDSGELNSQHVSIINYGSESVTAKDVNQAIQSAILEKGEATYEVHNVKKDGTPFWCSATTCVFKHPEYGNVLVAVQQDITERKLIEDALRESEEKFRQMAENIQAVFWMTDFHNQQVLYVSKAYETIWQRNCQSVYQSFSDWLDAIHPDDRHQVDIAFTEKIRSGQSDIKYRIIRPDHSIRWIRDRAFPIKNEAGEIIRIAGIAEDITELQKIEQMKSEFIGIVSHELRTPLTSIRAAMGLLNSGIYDQKPDKSKRMIEIAAIESERLVRLVNDILDLERLESGRAVLEKTTCNAADLIQQAVAGVNAIAKQQYITFNIHPTDAKVWAAADAIIQTLTNLLSNALKFSPPDSTITLSVQQQTDRVLFQISDQGRGIPAEKLELIFGRFQQVDASDSRDKGGTGLGLTICRSIIEQHGGNIWAQSTLGVGSTFFFTLPFAR